MTITWPSAEEITVIDDIRDAIGREVTFYVVASSVACTQPNCFLDPVTNTSTNSFCTVCSGNYWIPIYSGANINAHITWAYSEQLGWVSGGQLAEGDCRIQVKYTVTNLDIVDRAKTVLVDGKTMEIARKNLRGVPNINRILIDLKELEKE